MAIYRCEVKHRSKSDKGTAAAHAAYIARAGRYSRLGDADSCVAWSGNMPEWSQENPGDFWTAADTHERSNGRVYTEILVSLPRELSPEQREELIRDYIKDEIGERFPYTVATHNPNAADGDEQPHAHVMISTRENDGIERSADKFFKRHNPQNPEKGGAKKAEEWRQYDPNNEQINRVRERWERHTNEALERAKVEARVDRRSRKEQGLEGEPEPKLSPVDVQSIKTNQPTPRAQEVLDLRDYRARQEQKREQERAREERELPDFVMSEKPKQPRNPTRIEPIKEAPEPQKRGFFGWFRDLLGRFKYSITTEMLQEQRKRPRPGGVPLGHRPARKKSWWDWLGRRTPSPIIYEVPRPEPERQPPKPERLRVWSPVLTTVDPRLTLARRSVDLQIERRRTTDQNRRAAIDAEIKTVAAERVRLREAEKQQRRHRRGVA